MNRRCSLALLPLALLVAVGCDGGSSTAAGGDTFTRDVASDGTPERDVSEAGDTVVAPDVTPIACREALLEGLTECLRTAGWPVQPMQDEERALFLTLQAPAACDGDGGAAGLPASPWPHCEPVDSPAPLDDERCGAACDRRAEFPSGWLDPARAEDDEACREACAASSGGAERVWSCAADAPSSDWLDIACFGVNVPQACLYDAQLTASCLADSCPALRPHLALLRPMLAMRCSQGQGWPARLPGTATPCDATADRAALDALDFDPGELGLVCDLGPAEDPALCRAACDVLVPCTSDGGQGERGAAARCRLACEAGHGLPAAFWPCVAESASCSDLEACEADAPR